MSSAIKERAELARRAESSPTADDGLRASRLGSGLPDGCRERQASYGPNQQAVDRQLYQTVLASGGPPGWCLSGL